MVPASAIFKLLLLTPLLKSLMDRVFYCRGCGSSHTKWRGYVAHVHQSTDELCQQAYDLDQGLLSFSDDDDPTMSPNRLRIPDFSDDDDNRPSPFEGDALGSAEEYAFDDFGQGMDVDLEGGGERVEGTQQAEVGRDNVPIMSELDVVDPLVPNAEDFGGTDDDEGAERAMCAQLENAWEPERPVQDPSCATTTAAPPANENADNDLAQQLRQDRVVAEGLLIGKEGLGPKPAAITKFSDKYTSSQCGQPITHSECIDSRYELHVNGTGNPWAPFLSKMEWEVSRWAKLRGPSSTAFSELLAIEGVSFSLIFFFILEV